MVPRAPRRVFERCRLALTTATVLLALSRTATAQTPTPTPAAPVASPTAPPPAGNDIVYLKSGGFVRGTLIDFAPGQSARIQLVTGEVSTIPWPAIDHVVATAGPGSALPAGPATPTPTPSTPSAPPSVSLPSSPRDEPAPSRRVRLHVEAPVDVEIVGRPNEGNAGWTTVCTGACDRPVPVEWQYMVRGEGIKTSAAFSVDPEASGATTVKVDPAYKTTFALGIVSIVIGGTAFTVGPILSLIGALLNGTSTTTSTGNEIPVTTSNQGQYDGLVVAGAVTAGVGLGLMVGGMFMTFRNLGTDVKPSSGPDASGSLPPRYAVEPTRVGQGLSLPTPTEVPLMSVSF